MKFNKFEDFVEKYGFSELTPMTYTEFTNKFTKATSKEVILYKDYMEKTTFGDMRDNHEEYLTIVYNFLYKDPLGVLRKWWNDHCELDNQNAFKDLYFEYVSVEKNGKINGKANSKGGRLIKNLFYDERCFV